MKPVLGAAIGGFVGCLMFRAVGAAVGAGVGCYVGAKV